MTKDLREHKTNLSTTPSASQPQRAHIHGFVRAELDFCAGESRILSVRGDLSM